MKRIIFGLTLALLFCSLAEGKNRTVKENDSQGNLKRVIELNDTVINGKTVADTLSITTYEAATKDSTDDADDWKHQEDTGFGWSIGKDKTLIAMTAIIFSFGFPIIVITIVFYFRYKNRKEKYRLAEQALASGQQLPENLFKATETEDIRSKGIRNIFTGTGLFIFLWAITGNFGVGCIGLLIMFTGFGQLVIFYGQKKKNDEK